MIFHGFRIPFFLSISIRSISFFSILLWLGFLSLWYSPGQADSLPVSIPPTHISVIIDDDYPPFVYRDENGIIHGARIEYWNLWEIKTGIKVRFLAMDFDRGLQTMREGKGDVLDLMFFTRKRAEKYLYSKPYFQIKVGVFMHKTLTGITDLKTLLGFTVGVKAGDACIEVFARNGITTLREYRSYEAIIKAAAAGDIKVFCVDNPPAFYYLSKLNLENEFSHCFNLYTGEFHYVVKKDRLDLLKIVDDGFSRFSIGEKMRIDKKWLGKPILSGSNIYYIFYSLLIILTIALILLFLNFILRRQVRSKTLALENILRELRISEEKYRSIFENTAEGIFQISPQGIIFRANPALVSMLGFSSVSEMTSSIAELHYDLFLSPNDWDHFCNLHDRSGGQIRNFRIILQARNHDYIWCSINSHTVMNESGNLIYYEGTITDISEQMKAETALRQSQEYYSKLLTALPDLVIHADLKGVILDCNDAIQPMLGMTREVAIGKSIFQFLSEKNYRRTVLSILRQIRHGYVSQEYHLTLDHGNVKYFEVNSNILKDQHGKPFAVVNVCRDITQRKQIEVALRESEASYRGLFNTTKESIYIIDNQGRFIDVNAGAIEMYGYSQEEFSGKTLAYLSALDKNVSLNLVERVVRTLTGELQQFEFWGRRNNGEIFPQNVKMFKGQYFGQEVIIAFSEDISERKKAEEERLEMERKLLHVQKLESLGVLAGGIAHDFNNILMAILGHADIALHLHSVESPLSDKLNEIKKASRRGAELCRQMLAYAGKGKFIIQLINLNDMVIEMVNLLKISISKKVTLDLKMEPELPPIDGDITQIRQILMNLITNASEAIGDLSGTITITTGLTVCTPEDFTLAVVTEKMDGGSYLFLEVNDTGSGMSQETITRIFEPFFTTKFTGRGLGMPAVLGIVRGHKGNMRIQSQVGRGSTFTIYLPINSDSLLIVPAISPSVELIRQGEGLILLVDDEEPVRSVCQEMLEHLGYEIITAGDGEEAIELYRELFSRIELVLLDLIMPRMDGVETFHQMIRIDPQARIIISSGFTEQEISIRFKDNTPAGFIQKPFALNQLAEKVQSVISS